jgi:hypothetical protein
MIEEQQQPHMKEVPTNEAPQGLKEQENQPFQITTKSMLVKNMLVKNMLMKNFKWSNEEFQMEGDPTSFEEAMRSDYSLKWLEAMQDEMISMNTNDVWDLEEIPNGAKTVGSKRVYKIKCDSKGNVERF